MMGTSSSSTMAISLDFSFNASEILDRLSQDSTEDVLDSSPYDTNVEKSHSMMQPLTDMKWRTTGTPRRNLGTNFTLRAEILRRRCGTCACGQSNLSRGGDEESTDKRKSCKRHAHSTPPKGAGSDTAGHLLRAVAGYSRPSRCGDHVTA